MVALPGPAQELLLRRIRIDGSGMQGHRVEACRSTAAWRADRRRWREAQIPAQARLVGLCLFCFFITLFFEAARLTQAVHQANSLPASKKIGIWQQKLL